VLARVTHSNGSGLRSRFRQTKDQKQSPHDFAVASRPVALAGVIALVLAFSAIAFVRFGWTSRFWFLIPLFVALSTVVVLDLRLKLIPDVLTLSGIIYALAFAALIDASSFGRAVLGAIAGGGIVLLLAVISRGAVGGGDIKLTAMLGAALGWKGALAVLAFSHVLAAVVVLGLIIARGAGKHDGFPIGAIIAFVGAVTLVGAPP